MCFLFVVEFYVCKIRRATDSAYCPIVIWRVVNNNCKSAKLCLIFVRTEPEFCCHHRKRKSNNFLMGLLGLVASYVARTCNILE
jgi:hypothetical protein